MIEVYCMALLSDHPHLKTVVGIAVDASSFQPEALAAPKI